MEDNRKHSPLKEENEFTGKITELFIELLGKQETFSQKMDVTKEKCGNQDCTQIMPLNHSYESTA